MEEAVKATRELDGDGRIGNHCGLVRGSCLEIYHKESGEKMQRLHWRAEEALLNVGIHSRNNDIVAVIPALQSNDLN